MKALILKYTAMLLLLIGAVAFAFGLPRRDLRSTAQVSGIALDEQDGRLIATFELYVPSTEDPIGSKRETVTTVGSDLRECMERTRLIGGEALFTDNASALILGSGNEDVLLQALFNHYRELKNDQMSLPVFFTLDQSGGQIFEGEGAVLSNELAESAKAVGMVQTVRDLMNGVGSRVRIRGEGSYEIIS